MNLYQLDKQSTKFTIWKYCKCRMKKLDGNFYRLEFAKFIVRQRMLNSDLLSMILEKKRRKYTDNFVGILIQ